jgi:hypothetical protein
MSKKKIFWGSSEKEFKQAKEAEKEVPDTIDEALSQVEYEQLDNSAYGICKYDNKFRIIKFNYNISSLQTETTMLDYVYDYEYQAVVMLNQLNAEEAKKFRR